MCYTSLHGYMLSPHILPPAASRLEHCLHGLETLPSLQRKQSKVHWLEEKNNTLTIFILFWAQYSKHENMKHPQRKVQFVHSQEQ